MRRNAIGLALLAGAAIAVTFVSPYIYGAYLVYEPETPDFVVFEPVRKSGMLRAVLADPEHDVLTEMSAALAWQVKGDNEEASVFVEGQLGYREALEEINRRREKQVARQ